jgi:putative oxygen-independent coproporphyrinogen III oxidase
MAGIYFHIPFCHQACHYCDFHFSTLKGAERSMVDAMVTELRLRAVELQGENIETIYFGGGTPSILAPGLLALLLEAASDIFRVEPGAEITLEANPEDLTVERMSAWRNMGINRLSIGIQSFQDIDLRYMNRNHDAEQAVACIEAARSLGFHDLTIDLIYGTPTMDDAAWENNLSRMAELDLPHFSAYALTVEPRTALHHMVRNRLVTEPEEEQAARQFHILMEWAKSNGYEHYEISNFSRSGRHSRHNTSYWQGKPYLGIGPSAHGFSRNVRRWNVRNNTAYIKSLQQGDTCYEEEVLGRDDLYNEFVMTGMRTKWGVDRKELTGRFGEELLAHFEEHLLRSIDPRWVEDRQGVVVLTDAGKLFADRIASALFI